MLVEKNTFDAWLQASKKGEKMMYYKGFYCKAACGSLEMRKFSTYLNKLVKNGNGLALYQKKIEKGNDNKDAVYEYYAEKL
ncbi:MAG: hypothetical protein VW200_03745 [Pelagibacteraceae bacterium]